MSPVRVRIAPSPTGDPHVGTGYIALFNYAFARQQGGAFILRIEDTDRQRSSSQSEAAILASLRWLGLTWDEGPDVGGPLGPYRQSERLAIYREHVERLITLGHAYWCTCSEERLAALRKEQMARKENPGYDRRCRSRAPSEVRAELEAGSRGVVRLKVPTEGLTTFVDKLRGPIEIQNGQIDDQVLLKGDGFPTYHLANVVDDRLMGITHVIRGEEWITSTPKHVLLYEAFGWPRPEFAHLPLLRNADKSKVSKRKNPVSLRYFQEAGYLPETMINFLGMMAFTFPDGRELFTLSELAAGFSLDRVSLGGPVFDLAKLLWLNGRYLRERKSDAEWLTYLRERVFPDEYLARIVPLVRERVDKSEDFVAYADFFFKGKVEVAPAELMLKERSKRDVLGLYEELAELLDGLLDYAAPALEGALRQFSETKAVPTKLLFPAIRAMVTGKAATPPLFDVLSVLGKERVRARVRAAIAALKTMPG